MAIFQVMCFVTEHGFEEPIQIAGPFRFTGAESWNIAILPIALPFHPILSSLRTVSTLPCLVTGDDKCIAGIIRLENLITTG